MRRRSGRSARGCQDSGHKAGKPAVEFVAAQGVDLLKPLINKKKKARVAQHPEMVRHAGLRPAAVEGGTGRRAFSIEPLDDFQANRIAQRVEHILEPDVLDRWVSIGAHAQSLA